jgi:hypothetical protein
MPCFFGLRTRVVSDRDKASSWGSAVLLVPFAGDAVESGSCIVLATCGSSPLALLSALLRKTLRRLVARKTGPLALSSMVIAELCRGCRLSMLLQWTRCGVNVWSSSSRLGGPCTASRLVDLSARLSTAPTLLWFYCATKRYALYSARDLIKEVVLFEKSQHHDLFASRNP